jgi:hypothetical protein
MWGHQLFDLIAIAVIVITLQEFSGTVSSDSANRLWAKVLG